MRKLPIPGVRFRRLTLLALLSLVPQGALALDCVVPEVEGANFFAWRGKLALVVEGLESTVVPERVNRVRCLASFPVADALPWLRLSLEDPAADVQLAALEALQVLGARAAAPQVMALLEHRDSDIRAAAALTLGVLYERDAVERLLVLLADANAMVRLAAVQALAALRDPVATPALAAILSDDSREVVMAALEALGALGDPATVYAVLDKCRDPVISIRVAAIKALGALRDPRALSTLAQMLREQPTEVKRAALRAIAAIGDPAAVDLLLALLAFGEGDEVLSGVIRVLGQLGDARAVAPLLSFARQSGYHTAIGQALARIGEPALPLVMKALEESEQLEIQTMLIRVLGRIPSATATRALEAALLTDRYSQEDLLLALAQNRDPRAVEVLAPRMQGMSEKVLMGVLQRLAQRPDARVIAPLVERYPGASRASRLTMLATFAWVGHSSALPIVLEELQQSDMALRRRAIFAAQAIGDEAARDPLLAIMNEKDNALHHDAAVALARLGQRKTAEALLKMAKDSQHPARREAMWALSLVVRDLKWEAPQDFARSLLQDPQHPLAYLALDLLLTKRLSPTAAQAEMIMAEGRISLQRKLLELVSVVRPAWGAEVVAQALRAEDEVVVAEAAWAAAYVELADTSPLLDLAQARSSAVACNALVSLGRLGFEQAAASVVQGRLFDSNPWVAACAAWALPRVHTEPDHKILEVLLYRAENPFLRHNLLHALGRAAAVEAAPSEVPWVVIDVTEGDERVIGEGAALLLPDGSVKLVFSDEMGKIRLELESPGEVRQLYLRRTYVDYQRELLRWRNEY